MAKNRGARSKAQADTIHREWGGLPIVDAESDVRVALVDEDGSEARPGDGENCLLAQACKRQFGSTKVVFFRRVAYIELPGENGDHRVERFMISAASHDLIRQFDETGEVKSGGAFVMRAPRPAERLDAQRQYNQEYHEKLRSGEHKVDPKKAAANKRGASNRPVLVGNHLLRSGAGKANHVA